MRALADVTTSPSGVVVGVPVMGRCRDALDSVIRGPRDFNSQTRLVILKWLEILPLGRQQRGRHVLVSSGDDACA